MEFHTSIALFTCTISYSYGVFLNYILDQRAYRIHKDVFHLFYLFQYSIYYMM